MKSFRGFGPGFLVTAAFIGPGTVTTASLAGANFGFDLIWALVFSIVATLVLQEMAARLGLATGRGLGEAIRESLPHPIARTLAAGLIIAAIGIGNAAFQTGNITGAAIGIEALTGVSPRLASFAIGLAAFLLLASGKYRWIQTLLIALVILMSLAFLGAAVIVRPDVSTLIERILRPRMPSNSLWTVLALVGTTVVPYNLFLHASAVREKWPPDVPLSESLPAARWDTLLSVSLGGLITLAILATAAEAFFGKETRIENAGDMAVQLKPLLGPSAKWLFAGGLVAAGLTSAMTAPLAAAYAVRGVLGWPESLNDWKFRAVWITVLTLGTAFAILGKRPIAAILFAQAANGILLPIVAAFLLWVMNRRSLLGQNANGPKANLLGGAIVLTALGLGIVQILKGLGLN